MTYARLADTSSLGVKSMDEVLNELTDESGQFNVLPISAESAGLLPKLEERDKFRGSDLLLEAVLEEDVAHKANEFFAQAQKHMKNE